MAKPGRGRYTAKSSTPPEVADAMGRVFDHWRAKVESVREKLLGLTPGSLAWQQTTRRMRAIEIVLRGLYGREQIGEARLIAALDAYAVEVGKAWYRDDPLNKIRSLVDWMGDEDQVSKWTLAATAGRAVDERAAERKLMAARRAAEPARASAVTAEQDRAAWAEFNRLASEDRDGLLRIIAAVAEGWQPVDVTKLARAPGSVAWRAMRAIRARLFPTPATAIGAVLERTTGS